MNTNFTHAQNICHNIKNDLEIKLSAPTFFISDWVSITSDDIIKALSHKPECSIAELRRAALDYIIQRINDASYGAGCIYELYESRRQEAIKNALLCLSTQLSEHELTYCKQSLAYEENFHNEATCCEICDCVINANEIARSLHYTAQMLCYSCCADSV